MMAVARVDGANGEQASLTNPSPEARPRRRGPPVGLPGEVRPAQADTGIVETVAIVPCQTSVNGVRLSRTVRPERGGRAT